MFGTVTKMTARRNINKLCKSLCSHVNIFTAPILHGRHYEKIALEKFEELSKKFKDKTSSTKYNHYALEALNLSAENGVMPEFMPFEADNLFDKVKKFMEAAKKHGV